MGLLLDWLCPKCKQVFCCGFIKYKWCMKILSHPAPGLYILPRHFETSNWTSHQLPLIQPSLNKLTIRNCRNLSCTSLSFETGLAKYNFKWEQIKVKKQYKLTWKIKWCLVESLRLPSVSWPVLSQQSKTEVLTAVTAVLHMQCLFGLKMVLQNIKATLGKTHSPCILKLHSVTEKLVTFDKSRGPMISMLELNRADLYQISRSLDCYALFTTTLRHEKWVNHVRNVLFWCHFHFI